MSRLSWNKKGNKTREESPHHDCFFKVKAFKEKSLGCKSCPHYEKCKTLKKTHMLIPCHNCPEDFYQEKILYLENLHDIEINTCNSCITANDFTKFTGSF